MEVWKDVPGYEGFYQVSSLGNVKSVTRQVKKWDGHRTVKGKNKILYFCKNGYLRTRLFKNGRSENMLVHRLVSKAFVKNPDNKPCVNHKNGIKHDNRVENLEWVTYSENTRHAIETNLLTFKKGRYHHSFGKKNTKQCREKISKANSKLILDMQTGVFFKNTSEASKAYNIPVCTISRYLTGKIKTNKTNLKYV